MKKSFIIETGSELERLAVPYYRLYNAGPPKYGFNLEKRVAKYEAELNLAETEFWKLALDYVKRYFKEELKGQWYLAKLENMYLIETDSIYELSD